MPLDTTLAQSLAVEHLGITQGPGILEGDGSCTEEHKVVGDSQEGRRKVSRTGKTLLILPQPRLAPNILKNRIL